MKIRFKISRIENLRATMGISIGEFSSKLPSISAGKIERIERGEEMPTINELTEICNVYDVSPVYFFADSDV